jgi:hypothetical protein
MKNLKPMLLGLVPLFSVIAAQAQEPFRLSVFYSFKSKESAVVVAKPFDVLHQNGKLSVELVGFGGAGANVGVIGGALGFRYQVHERISLWAGLGFSKEAATIDEMFSSLNGFGLGAAFGVEYRMRF